MADPKSSTIRISISLDEKNIPERIHWEADDADPGRHESKAMLLGFWDQTQGNGMSIDLWTKEMTVPEMNLFLYQTLLSMSDTLLRATGNRGLSEEMKQFASRLLDTPPPVSG